MSQGSCIREEAGSPLLGIDYGLERTGLAFTDPAGHIAFPLMTMSLGKLGSRKALLDAIAAEATARGASAIVMGLPLLADGSDSLTSRQVRNACARLMRRLSLPFFYMPEYLSTQAALDDLRACGLRGSKFRAVLDQQAACLILQSFIDAPGSGIRA